MHVHQVTILLLLLPNTDRLQPVEDYVRGQIPSYMWR